MRAVAAIEMSNLLYERTREILENIISHLQYPFLKYRKENGFMPSLYLIRILYLVLI